MKILERQEQPMNEREQLLAEAEWHENLPLSESMSSKAVQSFFAHQFEAQRLRAIVMISDTTELPIIEVSQRSIIEHCVVSSLLRQQKVEEARQLIKNPEDARERHPDLFEAAEKWVNSQSERLGFNSFD